MYTEPVENYWVKSLQLIKPGSLHSSFRIKPDYSSYFRKLMHNIAIHSHVPYNAFKALSIGQPYRSHSRFAQQL